VCPVPRWRSNRELAEHCVHAPLLRDPSLCLQLLRTPVGTSHCMKPSSEANLPVWHGTSWSQTHGMRSQTPVHRPNSLTQGREGSFLLDGPCCERSSRTCPEAPSQATSTRRKVTTEVRSGRHAPHSIARVCSDLGVRSAGEPIPGGPTDHLSP